jgi:ABC-type multidrug transport system ATPase subunit
VSAALSTHQLTKHYAVGSDGERPALAPLDLDIADGSLVALIGHNGSGKTTLLRMVAGLLDPTGGTIEVHGHGVGSAAARAAVSYLADQPTFYDDLSLVEHLEYVARLHGVAEWQGRAHELTARLGLSERLDQVPTTFSRGLRQKASIALAFVRPFSLLLVDEPFVGLDSAGKEALLDLFAEAHRAGAAVVVATHELGFVSRVERLVALADGEVRYDGPPDGADAQTLVIPG